MGPGDPYNQAHRADAGPSSEPSAVSAAELVAALKEARASRPAMYGLVVGAIIGIMILLDIVAEGLFVLLCAVIGAAVAWTAHGFATGRFDLGAAWTALRGDR